MARWHAAVAVAVLFLCLLLVTAPARLLGYLVPAPQLRLHGFHGSLWRGSTDSAALATSGGYLQLGRMQWDLSPWSLLLLSPRIELEARWGSQTVVADISVSPAGVVRLRDVSLNFPAQLIRHWLPVELRGSINVLAEDLSFLDLRPQAGSGRLVWQGARWIGNTTSENLGDYLLEFQFGEAQQLDGTITTLSGPVFVKGLVGMQQQQYRVDLELSSETGVGAEMGSALELVAEPTATGYRIKLEGSL